MSDGGPSEETFEEYKQGEDVPLFSYGVLAGAFNLAFAGFLLDLRPRARAARHPPDSDRFHHPHPLRSPPPDLQSPYEEGLRD